MKKKNNTFSFFKHYKDSFSTAFVAPIISVSIIGVILLTLGYENDVLDLKWIVILSILLSIIVIGAILWFVLATIHALVKQEKEETIVQCQTCSLDYKKYIFYRHELISFDDICQLEKNLGDHPHPEMCEVYNYTTLSDTFQESTEGIVDEDKIENIIRANRRKNVKYYVFYLDPQFDALNDHNQTIYGEANMFDCTMHRNIFDEAEFDFLIHKTPEETKGYVAVNFTTHIERCETCTHKPCDYKNESRFYRVLSNIEVKYVYDQLAQIIKQHRKKENGKT